MANNPNIFSNVINELSKEEEEEATNMFGNSATNEESINPPSSDDELTEADMQRYHEVIATQQPLSFGNVGSTPMRIPCSWQRPTRRRPESKTIKATENAASSTIYKQFQLWLKEDEKHKKDVKDLKQTINSKALIHKLKGRNPQLKIWEYIIDPMLMEIVNTKELMIQVRADIEMLRVQEMEVLYHGFWDGSKAEEILTRAAMLASSSLETAYAEKNIEMFEVERTNQILSSCAQILKRLEWQKSLELKQLALKQREALIAVKYEIGFDDSHGLKYKNGENGWMKQLDWAKKNIIRVLKEKEAIKKKMSCMNVCDFAFKENGEQWKSCKDGCDKQYEKEFHGAQGYGKATDLEKIEFEKIRLAKERRDGMKIYVKVFNGKTITLEVRPLDTIGAIKRHIEVDEGLKKDSFDLIFNGFGEMEDHRTLSDYNVPKEATLHLVEKKLFVTDSSFRMRTFLRGADSHLAASSPTVADTVAGGKTHKRKTKKRKTHKRKTKKRKTHKRKTKKRKTQKGKLIKRKPRKRKTRKKIRK